MATYIVEGTDHLNVLVNQVLQFARPLQPHFEMVDMVNWMEELRHHILADPAVQAQKVSIVLVHNEAALAMNIDVVLLQSAMLNLIFNAIQAMPLGGTITIVLEKHTQLTSISITDTGVGITTGKSLEDLFPFLHYKIRGNRPWACRGTKG